MPWSTGLQHENGPTSGGPRPLHHPTPPSDSLLPSASSIIFLPKKLIPVTELPTLGRYISELEIPRREGGDGNRHRGGPLTRGGI
ncbi:hypothetical protein EVAR_38831_1 [Eumeta japonica]|uniref:Uncharacterized protein n=1 Tax=Eumeta variegata TaxID=151549 RepID=A0A4C1XR83_EUMVA|nr:hypothetical protein EVAR_38831_1 [Eumeta japonica]